MGDINVTGWLGSLLDDEDDDPRRNNPLDDTPAAAAPRTVSPFPFGETREAVPAFPFGPRTEDPGAAPRVAEPPQRPPAKVDAKAHARALRLYRRRAILPAMEGEPTAPVFPFGAHDVSEPPIARASRAVGVPQRYLEALTEHESGGDSRARNPKSSALGHGQWLERPWLNTIARYGARYGLGQGELANLSRRDLLELREDPLWSALMSAENSRENGATLRTLLGRDPRENELYLAHFAGPALASVLVRAADADRAREGGRATRGADVVPPEVVAANRSVFYDGNRARAVTEVVERLSARFRRDFYTPGERGF